MVLLQAAQHHACSDHVELSQPLHTLIRVHTSDGVQEFLVEDGSMLGRSMLAMGAHIILGDGPMELSAVATLAEVVGEGTDREKAQEGEEFANAVLHRSAAEAPLVRALQSEASLRNTRGALLDTVRFVQDHTVEMDSMDGGIFFDDLVATSPTFLLLAEHGLERVVGHDNDVVATNLGHGDVLGFLV